MDVRINVQTGTFSLLHDGKMLIDDGFPGIDGWPIRVSGVKIQQDTVCYITPEGELTLRFEKYSANEIRIHAALKNFGPVHILALVCNAITKPSALYQYGRHTGYESGYVPMTKEPPAKPVHSYGIGGLQFQDHWLIASVEKYEDYENRFSFQNGWTLDFNFEKANPRELTLPVIKLVWTDQLQKTLAEAADSIGTAMNARKKNPPAYHWCSWYYCYHNFDQAQVEEYLAGFKKYGLEKELRYMQLDAGYFSAVGDWLEPNCERFPEGLQKALKTIASCGLKPGIWIAPFMVGNRSKLYQNHPDWVLHKHDGTPHAETKTYNEPKLWGYQDEEYYVLDTSHPEAMAYILNCFKTLKEWGAEFFKTDFLWYGLLDNTAFRRHTPGKTSIQYFRELMKEIRTVIGESYWLGCLGHFLPIVGYADAMRIGGDVGAFWKEGSFGPQNMINTLIGMNFTNGALFQNDPDAVMLRDFHIGLTETEIQSLARLSAMSTGCIYTSDPLHKIPQHRRDLFNYIKPTRIQRAFIPYLETAKDEIVLTQTSKDKQRMLVFFFNKTDRDITDMYALKDFQCDTPMYVYDLDAKMWLSKESQQQLFVKTPPHGHRLFLLSKDAAYQPDHTRMFNNI